MGLFNTLGERIRRHRARRRAIRSFRSYVDPKLVDHVLSTPAASPPPPRTAEVNFLLAIVAHDDLLQLPELLAKTVAVLRSSGAWLDSFSGPLVFATFGTHPKLSSSDPRGQRQNTVSRLRAELGHNVRIVHGIRRGIVGEIVSDWSCAHFGSALHQYDEVLKTLASLSPGEIRELTE